MIHHGGIGTTVGLLAAGLPQLIVPRGFDQPQTAHRMRSLGVARTIPWVRASQATLTRGLDRLLGTEDHRKRAAEIAAALHREPGLAQGVDTIEQLVA